MFLKPTAFFRFAASSLSMTPRATLNKSLAAGASSVWAVCGVDRVGTPIAGSPSHRTVLVLFTYGSSGPWVMTPTAGRLTTSTIRRPVHVEPSIGPPCARGFPSLFHGRCLCLSRLGLCLELRARSHRPQVVGVYTFAGGLFGPPCRLHQSPDQVALTFVRPQPPSLPQGFRPGLGPAFTGLALLRGCL